MHHLIVHVSSPPFSVQEIRLSCAGRTSFMHAWATCIVHCKNHQLIGSQVPHASNSELSEPSSYPHYCTSTVAIQPIYSYTMSIRPTLLRSLNARRAVAVRGISSTGPKRAGHQESHGEDDSTHTHECMSTSYQA